MASLVWDQVGDRLFETGISKCVLYQSDGSGVAWNGLTSVDEDPAVEVEPVYFDGFKFNDLVTLGDYSGTLRAFTYPHEFLALEGIVANQSGFYFTNQPQSRFHLSYRTEVGNDVDSIGAGYKIHIIYNLTAIPSQKSYKTLGLDVSPNEFEWAISSIPEESGNYRPTSHVIIDSREMDPYLLADLEGVLYGNEDGDAQLPSLNGLSAFVRKWNRLIITEYDDGTWSAEAIDDSITMLDSITFQIISDTAEYLDADTYEISSSEKNEEDI